MEACQVATVSVVTATATSTTLPNIASNAKKLKRKLKKAQKLIKEFELAKTNDAIKRVRRETL